MTPEYGNDAQMRSFLYDHALEHDLLSQILAQQGKMVVQYDLTREPDALWFSNHASMHDALDAAVAQPATAAGLKEGFSDYDTFQHWMQNNMEAHVAYRKALGIG